jgi:hypothetical protein
MDSPTMKTFDTVPRPGRCRSGHHSSSTSAPTTMETLPMLSPLCFETP